MKYCAATIYLSCLVAQSQISSVASLQSSVSRKRSFAHRDQTYARVVALNQAFNNEDLVTTRRVREQPSSLKAFTVDAFDVQCDDSGKDMLRLPTLSSGFAGVQAVVTTALMVTGNTIGAGALVLPEIAAKPGMVVSAGLFVGAYVVNLISGMVIAEVAIRQHELSGNDVAASFKDFAEANLDNSFATSVVAGMSIFTNACILVFGLNRAGEVASSMLGGALGPTESMIGFAAVLVAMGLTQSGENMSKICSALVMGLFVSFLGLLVPGLANVHDPMGAFLSPGTCECGVSEAAPIILMSMVYQNIVPTVTKILNYDRVRSVTAIALGSLLPLCLYLAWCFACIGGGVDVNAVGAGGALMTVFSITAISGSAIGCAMSLTEELDSLLPNLEKGSMPQIDRTSIAVLASVAIPAAIAFAYAGSEDFNTALKIAGSYGSPLLYGAVPAAMAWTQREKVNGTGDIPSIVPGGSASLAGLGIASMALVFQELSIDIASFLS